MWGFFAGRYPRSFRSALQPANMLCSPRAPVRVKLGSLFPEWRGIGLGHQEMTLLQEHGSPLGFPCISSQPARTLFLADSMSRRGVVCSLKPYIIIRKVKSHGSRG